MQTLTPSNRDEENLKGKTRLVTFLQIGTLSLFIVINVKKKDFTVGEDGTNATDIAVRNFCDPLSSDRRPNS